MISILPQSCNPHIKLRTTPKPEMENIIGASGSSSEKIAVLMYVRIYVSVYVAICGPRAHHTIMHVQASLACVHIN